MLATWQRKWNGFLVCRDRRYRIWSRGDQI